MLAASRKSGILKEIVKFVEEALAEWPDEEHDRIIPEKFPMSAQVRSILSKIVARGKGIEEVKILWDIPCMENQQR